MKYISLTPQDQAAMCQTLGIAGVDELFSDIPSTLKLNRKLDLPEALSEMELERSLKETANKNRLGGEKGFFLGAGAYRHYIPSPVYQLVTRGEFYTPYTPYQPEVSQGLLQTFFEYQSMVCRLSGLAVSNASLYDGATGVVEAAVVAHRVNGRKTVLVSAGLHPEYREVLKTYLAASPLQIKELPLLENGLTALPEETEFQEAAALIIQQPNFFGCLEEAEMFAQKAKAAKCLTVGVVTDPVSLGILTTPGAWGADIFVGEGQALGIPLSFGGPGLGLIAARQEYVRHLPGRIIGESVDKDGKRAFCLTLQTREQHIKRERATSNICSNHALMAAASTVYLALMGKSGLTNAARRSLELAHLAQDKIGKLAGYSPAFSAPFFHEFTVNCPDEAEKIFSHLEKKGLTGGLPLGRFFPERNRQMLFCLTELNTEKEVEELVKALEEYR